MKERENELTTRPNLTNLETGDIFMPEGGEGPKPNETDSEKRVAQKPLAQISEVVTEKINPAVQQIAGDVRKIREGKESSDLSREKTNLKRRVSRQWNNAYPNLDKATDELRAFVRASIEEGFTPDKLTDEQREILGEFAPKQPDLPLSRGRQEKPAAESVPHQPDASNIQQIKNAIDAVKRGEVPINPATGEPLVALTQEHAIKALEQQLKEAQEKGAEKSTREVSEESNPSEQISTEGGGGEKPPKPPTKEGQGEPEPEGNPEKIEVSGDAIERIRNDFDDMEKKARAVSNAFGFDFEIASEYLKEAKKAALENALSHRIERPITVPESLEDLARLIRKRSAPEYRAGGEKDLINENGTVNTVNFLDWTRENLLAVHNNNPLDPVNFFSDIGTSVRTDLYGGTISFYEITFGKSFFLQDKDGEKVINKEYEALHDQLYYEAFLLMFFRNPNIEYMQGRGEKESMMKVMRDTFIKNPLTRSNFFEVIMTMPSTTRDSILDQLPDEKKRELLDVKLGAHEALDKADILAKREGNFYVGNAVRGVLSAYINIFDYDQLKNVLGEDSPIFKIKNEETGQAGLTLTDKQKNDWFYSKDDVEKLKGKNITVKEGDIKLYKINRRTGDPYISTDGTGAAHPAFMEHINIFLGPTRDQKLQSEIRKLFSLSVMKKEGISEKEAEFAELFAYSLTHINGVAARNDVHSVAFDWWTRLTNFKDYRKRQKAERRGAKYGSSHNLEGFKRLGLGFLEGARDIKGRSIRDIIQGGTGRDADISKNPFKNIADFEKDDTGRIKFLGDNNQELNLEVYDYETQGKSIVYKDRNGEVVDVGSAKPANVRLNKEKLPSIEFKQDLQKQFIPNHLIMGSEVYEWIINSVEAHFPEMVTGYDTHGNPILNQEKVNEVKEKIEKGLRYALSTWPEINFGEEDLEWERVEVRNENGFLVARKKGEQIGTDESGNPIHKQLLLDKDWYILDEKGNKTQERDEPKTYVESRVMTKLEAMFGIEALHFIQYEVEKRGLATGQDVKTISDETGKTINVDFSKAKEEEFRTAVWRGAFDYIIASEIAEHRDRGSGLRYYNSDDIKRTADALRVGEFVTPDEIKEIRKVTKTRARRVYSQDIGYAFVTGGMEGFWKAFQLIYKDVLSGK